MSELVEADTLAIPVRRVAWSITPPAWPTGRIIAGVAETDPISAQIRRHDAGFRKPGRTNNPRWPRIVTFGMPAAFRRDLTLADRPAGRKASGYRRPICMTPRSYRTCHATTAREPGSRI